MKLKNQTYLGLESIDDVVTMFSESGIRCVRKAAGEAVEEKEEKQCEEPQVM